MEIEAPEETEVVGGSKVDSDEVVGYSTRCRTNGIPSIPCQSRP